MIAADRDALFLVLISVAMQAGASSIIRTLKYTDL